jgi:hypothetical protein
MIALKYSSFKGLLLAATILPGPLILVTPIAATAQVGVVISVQVAPPMLPVYAQPPMPEEGYIWTPGYWQWAAPTGYYWVPGTWVLPPMAGVLWTPPYWGWSNGLYVFHAGYWGPHVGYYGGVNYGYGYGGVGFDGGRWEGGHFAYNRAVSNFGSAHVRHFYRQNVTVSNRSHASYAGGAGGLRAEPKAVERQAEHDTHLPVTSEQARHVAAAAGNPGLGASHNNGRPPIAATSRPGQFQGQGVVRSQENGRPPAASQPGQREAPHEAQQPAQREAPHAAPQPAQREAPRAAPQPTQREAPHAAPQPTQREAPHAAPQPTQREAPHAAPQPTQREAPRAAPQPTQREAPHAAPQPAQREAPHAAQHEGPAHDDKGHEH